MFAVMQRGAELKAVYSDSDFKYLQARGWVAQVTEPRHVIIICGADLVPKKRKGRPPKVKECQSPQTQS